MPQDHRSSKAEFPLETAQALRDQKFSYRQIAAEIGWSPGHVQRKLKAIPTNGHPSAPERTDSAPSMALEKIEFVAEPVSPEPSELERASALLINHESRIATLEAFIATLQRQAQHASAPERTSVPERTSAPVWIKRGTHIAADMAEALREYAAKHRLEIREVIDAALRSFFARQAPPGEEDGPHA